jgi:PAS domain S-box-containing protein
VDITEQRGFERSLAESQERLETVIRYLPSAVFAHFLDGKLVLVNRISSELTGWSEEELLGLTVSDIDGESTVRDDLSRFWVQMRFGETVRLETMHRRKDGSTYPAEVHLTKMRWQGKPFILGVANDISKRREAEQALRNSESKYRTLVENSLQSVLIIQDERIVFANQAASDLTGYTRDELMAMPAGWGSGNGCTRTTGACCTTATAAAWPGRRNRASTNSGSSLSRAKSSGWSRSLWHHLPGTTGSAVFLPRHHGAQASRSGSAGQRTTVPPVIRTRPAGLSITRCRRSFH